MRAGYPNHGEPENDLDAFTALHGALIQRRVGAAATPPRRRGCTGGALSRAVVERALVSARVAAAAQDGPAPVVAQWVGVTGPPPIISR
ncbi:MAG: hypothetical protein H0W40_06175 [Methylibium sp.]|uniref:hypothetical protein n=1 Tax=Methylibium sp. TaxID=2067992 RepID=UPI00185C12AB|nr:hypothetical protein [Methylibium sp.]MBA3596949.1 hypothetical protein [Methylibium sp.]